MTDLALFALQLLALVGVGAVLLATARWYQRRVHLRGRDRRHLFIDGRCVCGALLPVWSDR